MIRIILFMLLPVTLFAQRNRTEEQAIRKVMLEQQEAWNRADIESFMEGYWKSDSLKFIGRNGITYGWKTTLENYKKGYPTAETMGKLTFTILSLEVLSETSAYMVGRWQLKRQTDEPGGHFT